jgi:hypothetical protein
MTRRSEGSRVDGSRRIQSEAKAQWRQASLERHLALPIEERLRAALRLVLRSRVSEARLNDGR